MLLSPSLKTKLNSTPAGTDARSRHCTELFEVATVAHDGIVHLSYGKGTRYVGCQIFVEYFFISGCQPCCVFD